MRLAVYLALTGAVAMSLALPMAATRLTPKPAAILLSLGSLMAGLMWVGGLGLLAVATVGRAGLVGAVGHWSTGVLDARDPVPVLAGLASLGLLMLISRALFVALRGLVRAVIPLTRLSLKTRRHRCGGLSIVDDPRPDAMALPGWRGSVVVTSGMLRVLDAGEREVLLAHEHSHVRSRHWLHRIATRLGAALLPTSKPMVEACDRALERWADEDAARAVGDRRIVATAVARAALAASDHRRNVMAPAMADGAVVERVQAMLTVPPDSRRTPAALVGLLGVAVLIAFVEASSDLERMFEVAKHVWRG